MVAVPIPRPNQSAQPRSLGTGEAAPKPSDWTHLIAAGTLVAGGVLLVSGQKKAGLALAAAGTALALLEEPAVIESWWKSLPGYLADAQGFLEKVEGYMEQASTQGHRLQGILRRDSSR